MYHQPLDLIRAAKDTTAPSLNIYDGPAAKPKSIFSGFLNALHESRRLQARRILRRYEHLIARSKMRITHEGKQNSEGQEMLISGSTAQAKLAQLPASSEMASAS